MAPILSMAYVVGTQKSTRDQRLKNQHAVSREMTTSPMGRTPRYLDENEAELLTSDGSGGSGTVRLPWLRKQTRYYLMTDHMVQHKHGLLVHEIAE